LQPYSTLNFDASAGRNIRLSGGISGGGEEAVIDKTGQGALVINGISNEYRGSFLLRNGALVIGAGGSFSANRFDQSMGAVFDSSGNGQSDTFNAGALLLNGSTYIDADASARTADRFAVSSSFTAGATGNVRLAGDLFVRLNGALAPAQAQTPALLATLIDFNGELTGRFLTLNMFGGAVGDRTQFYLDYLADRVNLMYILSALNAALMPHNAAEVKKTFDRLEAAGPSGETAAIITAVNNMPQTADAQNALTRLSGDFLANAISMSALNTGREQLYARIKPRRSDAQPNVCALCQNAPALWAHAFGNTLRLDGDKNSPGQFTANGYGAQAGWEIINKERFAGGVYINYSDNTLKQQAAEADMQALGLGAYGGWFWGQWAFKTSLTLGRQNFKGKRNINIAGLTPMSAKADFNDYSIVFDGALEYNIALLELIALKPFLGAQSALIRNSAFTETGAPGANLEVKAGSYIRTTAFGGVELSGAESKLSWYANLYANLALSGKINKIEAHFAGARPAMDIWSAQHGALSANAGLGAEYEVFRNISLYANTGAGISDKSKNYWGNLGVNYKFCGGKTACPKPARAQEPLPAPPPAAVKPKQTLIIGDAYFSYGSAAAGPQLREYLKTRARELEQTQYSKIIITGHSDSAGPARGNQALSEARAKTVADYFIEYGISADKIEYFGLGESSPAADNTTARGRRLNRRAEIKVQ
jgi:autotransporter-associated beta strand protein